MVAFTKIGNTGRADLEGNDNFTIRSNEYIILIRHFHMEVSKW